MKRFLGRPLIVTFLLLAEPAFCENEYHFIVAVNPILATRVQGDKARGTVVSIGKETFEISIASSEFIRYLRSLPGKISYFLDGGLDAEDAEAILSAISLGENETAWSIREKKLIISPLDTIGYDSRNQPAFLFMRGARKLDLESEELKSVAPLKRTFFVSDSGSYTVRGQEGNLLISPCFGLFSDQELEEKVRLKPTLENLKTLRDCRYRVLQLMGIISKGLKSAVELVQFTIETQWKGLIYNEEANSNQVYLDGLDTAQSLGFGSGLSEVEWNCTRLTQIIGELVASALAPPPRPRRRR